MTDARKAEDGPEDVKDPLLSALTNETEPPDEGALKEAAKTGDDAATGGGPLQADQVSTRPNGRGQSAGSSFSARD